MRRRSLLLQLGTVEYGKTWELQKSLLEARASDKIEDCFILLQHPPTFTYGRRYKDDNLISNRRYYEDNGFAVYKTDRGGLATYHGTGQMVCYPILKMSNYTNDYYQYLRMLEEIIIRTLLNFGIKAERNGKYTGVWVNGAKIGFIGVRLALGYTMHGFSLNVNNDLLPFSYITPCGIQDVRITSVQELLGESVNIEEVYNKLKNHYSDVFQVQTVTVEMQTIVQRIGFEKEYNSDVSAPVEI